ncbi:MAG: hypothetical protein ACRBBO_00295 [Cognatishimia sp.]|uniref:hypothetical protein n=1 Tax=Cognatishimia sp. 1_MG-2023 TaxID=3062642 RepID=UPI0026E2CC27|nr:hypothetical protein [Cognatishimia sp. 1_MG-2023]MDO6726439.1 hypothetical protein [Cognatishimia sp. 1_MG-2023]
MRNAALVLGIIAGIVGMIVGFFGWGYTALIAEYGELDGIAEQVNNVELVRISALVSPLLAIAGGAMARARALWGGVLLLASAAGMYLGFGFNVFTMFPIAFAGLAGLLAVAAGKPDEPKAHF